MRPDIFIYISGPMTAKNGRTVEENCAEAAQVYWECLRRGYPAFCPHLSGLWPSAWSALPWEQWLEYDFHIINRCTHMLLLPRWKESDGARREREYAEARGVSIIVSIEEIPLLDVPVSHVETLSFQRGFARGRQEGLTVEERLP